MNDTRLFGRIMVQDTNGELDDKVTKGNDFSPLLFSPYTITMLPLVHESLSDIGKALMRVGRFGAERFEDELKVRCKYWSQEQQLMNSFVIDEYEQSSNGFFNLRNSWIRHGSQYKLNHFNANPYPDYQKIPRDIVPALFGVRKDCKTIFRGICALTGTEDVWADLAGNDAGAVFLSLRHGHFFLRTDKHFYDEKLPLDQTTQGWVAINMPGERYFVEQSQAIWDRYNYKKFIFKDDLSKNL